MSDLILAIITFIAGSMITWVVTNFYYQRSKKDVENQNNILIKQISKLKNELKSIDGHNKLALNEDRIGKSIG